MLLLEGAQPRGRGVQAPGEGLPGAPAGPPSLVQLGQLGRDISMWKESLTPFFILSCHWAFIKSESGTPVLIDS